MQQLKLTFLLGSGISRPAGLPSVEHITNAVLSGDGIVDRGEADLNYGRADHDKERELAAQACGRKRIIFLDWLKCQASCRYAKTPERSVNYEDLAYLAGQIADDIEYEYENPAIHPFVCRALNDLQGIFGDMTLTGARQELGELAKTTLKYIRQTVVSRLGEEPSEEEVRYLAFFSDACCDSAVREVSFFTVNHDKLLEDFLTNTLNNEEYRLLDGTCNTSSGDDSGRWDHRVYDAQENGRKLIKVYKLHGSIRCVCNQPPVLIGTFNKVFAYNSGPFLELHHRFKRALMDEDCAAIIVCGYGFGDKGVNTRLVEWIRQSPTHRLLIIDPKESEIVHARARGAIRNVINSILPRRELNQEANSRPLDEYVHAKWLGTFLVKHLQRSVGNRPTCDTKAVTWKEVKRLVTLTEAEFLASDH